MSDYSKKQFEKHDKWLENDVENIIKGKYIYKRNLKSIDNINIEKVKANNKNKNVGEIDYIIIDTEKKIIYVAECKFIKTKNHFASFTVDKNTFEKENGYINKQSYKTEWVKNNINHIEKEFKISNLSSFTTKGIFITNSSTYYSFNSIYPIIPLIELEDYLLNNKEY